MKVYLDLVFLLNFSYDFLLMMGVDVVLKRHKRVIRHLLAAFFGAISLFVLFLPFNSFVLFLFKISVSVLMLIVSFGYKNIKYFGTNFLYLYMMSVILGGFLYFLDLEFSTKREGLIFMFDGISVNYILLLLFGPVIIFLYILEHKRFKSTYNYAMKVDIVFKNGKTLSLNGFLDTGNKLRDVITKKYVILVPRKILSGYINIRSPIYVPFKALNTEGILECFSIKYLKVNGNIYENYLVGIANESFNLNGSECLLNYKLLEDIC